MVSANKAVVLGNKNKVVETNINIRDLYWMKMIVYSKMTVVANQFDNNYVCQ